MGTAGNHNQEQEKAEADSPFLIKRSIGEKIMDLQSPNLQECRLGDFFGKTLEFLPCFDRMGMLP